MTLLPVQVKFETTGTSERLSTHVDFKYCDESTPQRNPNEKSITTHEENPLDDLRQSLHWLLSDTAIFLLYPFNTTNAEPIADDEPQILNLADGNEKRNRNQNYFPPIRSEREAVIRIPHHRQSFSRKLKNWTQLLIGPWRFLVKMEQAKVYRLVQFAHGSH
jgi:hypothetical protein